jgi:hypothetical protein
MIKYGLETRLRYIRTMVRDDKPMIPRALNRFLQINIPKQLKKTCKNAVCWGGGPDLPGSSSFYSSSLPPGSVMGAGTGPKSLT